MILSRQTQLEFRSGKDIYSEEGQHVEAIASYDRQSQVPHSYRSIRYRKAVQIGILIKSSVNKTFVQRISIVGKSHAGFEIKIVDDRNVIDHTGIYARAVAISSF